MTGTSQPGPAAERPPVRLRLATGADAPAIASLYLRARKELVAVAPLAHSDAGVRAWVRSNLLHGTEVTVAEVEGTVVGFVAVALDSGDSGVGWVEQLYLLPEWLRQGIGSSLLGYVLEHLPPVVRLYSFQANQRALAFYRAHGFVEIARGDGSDNEEGCPDVLLEHRRSGG